MEKRRGHQPEFTDADYFIDPKVCNGCHYKNANATTGYCNYILMEGHSRPTANSTHKKCEVYRKADPKKEKKPTKRELAYA